MVSVATVESANIAAMGVMRIQPRSITLIGDSRADRRTLAIAVAVLFVAVLAAYISGRRPLIMFAGVVSIEFLALPLSICCIWWCSTRPVRSRGSDPLACLLSPRTPRPSPHRPAAAIPRSPSGRAARFVGVPLVSGYGVDGDPLVISRHYGLVVEAEAELLHYPGRAVVLEVADADDAVQVV
jgi:hypothetical protein